MREFRDRVAVVTGGASGIGRALARRFAGEGMKLVLADIEEPALEAAVKEFEAAGTETLGVVTDVRQAESVDALARQTLERFGAVHIVCNNAGVFAGGLSWECSVKDYEWVLGVNVWGVIHGVRSFVPILVEQDTEAHIVNTASMAGLTTFPMSSAYHMSKHAVLALSECLYKELAAQKVGVSVLCPEMVATNIADGDRNRPEELADAAPAASKTLVQQAIKDAIGRGISPDVLAERTFEAIRAERFYILADDSWREACNARLDDIREARNPTLFALQL